MKKSLIVALALMSCLLTGLVMAGEVALGVNEQADRNMAISQATKDAQAQLVLQKAAQTLGSSRLAAVWNQLSQEVLLNPAPYIKSFRTLAVSRQGGQTLVLVEGEVNEATLEQMLGRLPAATPQARAEQILSLVCEDVAPGRPALYWWSGQAGLAFCPARIERGLKALGYAPYNPSALVSSLGREITQNVVLTEQQAIAMGERAGTKLVLWGRMRTYPIVSSTATETAPLLQLALLSVESKRVLAQVEVEGAVFKDNIPVGFEDGMDKEVAAALAKLFDLAKIKISAPPQLKVTLELEGINSAAELTRLERALNRMEGLVLEVRRESLSLGRATLVLGTTQDGLAVANALEQLNQPGWQLRVIERTPAKVRIAPVTFSGRITY